MGIGASLSATLAGYITDHFGSPAAFMGLAAIAAIGFVVAWLLMPETRDAARSKQTNAVACGLRSARQHPAGFRPSYVSSAIRDGYKAGASSETRRRCGAMRSVMLR